MILYVLRYFPTATETFVHDEIRALRAAGLPVELAAFDAREDVGGEPPAPLSSQPHRWGWLPWLPALAVEWLRRPARSPRVLWLAALLRRRAIARVHVHFAGEAAAWAREACARVGVPYSVTVHAADLFKPAPTLPAVLADAAAVVTISAYNQAKLAAMGVATTLVRCGVELPDGRPSLAEPVVIAVGRAVPKKGLDLYVEVARRLAGRARFVLYSNLADAPGVEVRGLRPHGEVLAAVRSASLFVLPCRVAPDGDQDGIPVSLLEALAAGVPVVTTPVSGIPEVVDDAVGWLVPPDDVDALERAVADALDHPEERLRRGTAGPARLRERGFDRATTTSAMVRLLRG